MLNVSEIIQTVKQLIEVRIKLVKEEINEKVSTIMARMFLLVVMGTISVFVLLFASLSLAFYLSELMRSTYKGFLYVSLLNLLFMVLLYFLKDSKSLIHGFQEIIRTFLFKVKNKIDDED